MTRHRRHWLRALALAEERDFDPQAEPQRPVAEIAVQSLAREVRAHEQAGEQEHQRHEEGVVRHHHEVEAVPLRRIDDRRGCLRVIAAARCVATGAIGHHRVVQHDEENDEDAQIVEGGNPLRG